MSKDALRGILDGCGEDKDIRIGVIDRINAIGKKEEALKGAVQSKKDRYDTIMQFSQLEAAAANEATKQCFKDARMFSGLSRSDEDPRPWIPVYNEAIEACVGQGVYDYTMIEAITQPSELLSLEQVGDAAFVTRWLKTNEHQKPKPDTKLTELIQKAETTGNWGAAGKLYGSSMLRFPTPDAIIGYTDAQLHMLGEVRDREGDIHQKKIADTMDALDFYRSALAANSVLNSLPESEVARVRLSIRCLKRFNETGTYQPHCPPLHMYGLNWNAADLAEWSLMLRELVSSNTRSLTRLLKDVAAVGQTPSQRAIIDLRLSRQGKLIDAKIGQSSGIDRLDRAALEILIGLDRFPKPSPDVRGDPVLVQAPIDFKADIEAAR